MQVLEVTAVLAGASRLPVSVSLMVPLISAGESGEPVLVTTMVHTDAWPTAMGSGAQFLVTSTPGWNRLVLAVSVTGVVWRPAV